MSDYTLNFEDIKNVVPCDHSNSHVSVSRSHDEWFGRLVPPTPRGFHRVDDFPLG